MRKLLFFGLAVIGMLAGVQEASAQSAQTVYACKDNTSGLLFFYAVSPAAGCGANRTLETLTLGGALAGRAFKCGLGSVNANASISFAPSQSGVNFGTTISTSGAAPWTSFLLQPGIYLVHFSGGQGTPNDGLQIQAILNGNGQATWYDFGADAAIVGGDRLISVSAPNTTLTMVSNVAATFAPQCAFIIMQVQ
jgi:hypothetical protein